MEVKVKCYAGYRGEQEPVGFFLGERHIRVAEILDRWLAPDHRYFKLRSTDGAVYILRHDEALGIWEITSFQAG